MSATPAAILTVKDVWRGVLPERTELLAGGAGLDRRVDWATSLRTRPPAFEAIKGGEIAFVPVSRLRLLDERLTLAQVMTSLGEKGGAAVAVLGEVSAESIEVADRMMLPLLRLPDGVSLGEVQQRAVRFILDQRTQLHEKEQELRVVFTELALSGNGPPAILDRLVELVGGSAAWLEHDGTVRYQTGPLHLPAGDLRGDIEALHRSIGSLPIRAADPPVETVIHDAVSRHLAPIPVRDGVGGFVSLAGAEQGVARLAVARAASACAIEFERERAVTAARDDIEGEFVSTLLSGTYSSDEAMVERGRRMEMDLTGDTVTMVVAGEKRFSEAMIPAAKRWLERRVGGGLVAPTSTFLCLIVPASAQIDVKELAKEVHGVCQGAVGVGVALSVAVGRVHRGVSGVRASFREAEQTLQLGRRLASPDVVFSFADLGLHRLLFALREHPELRDFYDDHLGGLVDYDRKHHADLVATVAAFFVCHGSPTEMAGRLSVHRNTVLYRLRRIEEIGHLSLDDPMTRLSLHLSLRIAEVLLP